jgi:hypothetical protein
MVAGCQLIMVKIMLMASMGFGQIVIMDCCQMVLMNSGLVVMAIVWLRPSVNHKLIFFVLFIKSFFGF